MSEIFDPERERILEDLRAEYVDGESCPECDSNDLYLEVHARGVEACCTDCGWSEEVA